MGRKVAKFHLLLPVVNLFILVTKLGPLFVYLGFPQLQIVRVHEVHPLRHALALLTAAGSNDTSLLKRVRSEES